jgi:hypothetical protein
MEKQNPANCQKASRKKPCHEHVTLRLMNYIDYIMKCGILAGIVMRSAIEYISHEAFISL